MLADIEPVGVFILTFAGTREFTAPDSSTAAGARGKWKQRDGRHRLDAAVPSDSYHGEGGKTRPIAELQVKRRKI